MNQHFFQFPFGVNGDLAAVPQQSQVSGSVSYQSGYPFDYERDITNDPDALPIERTKMNQILNDVTTALQQYQVMGIPEWITATDNGGVSFPYAKFASVVFSGVCYVSQVANNTSTPGTDANWIVRPTTKNAPNLLFNSSAEFGIAGWTSSNFSPMSGGFGEGTFWENTAAIPNVTTMDTSQQIAIGAGVPLSIQSEIFAVGVTAGVGHVTVEAFTAANASLGVVASATAVNGQGWMFHSGSGTTPANTAYVLVHRAADTNPIVSINGLGFRRIKLEVGTQPSAYSQEADNMAFGVGPNAMPFAQVQSAARVQGFVGLNDGGTSPTLFDMSCTQVVLRNPSTGATYTVIAPAPVQVDVTIAGAVAGGRDIAAVFAASSCIRFFYIYNPTTRTLSAIASNNAPTTGPALPAGYTAWAYATSVFFTTASVLSIVHCCSSWVYYALPAVVVNGGSATTVTGVPLTTSVPIEATQFELEVGNLSIASTAGGAYNATLIIQIEAGKTAWTAGLQGVGLAAVNTFGVSGGAKRFAAVTQGFNYLINVGQGTGPLTSIGLCGYNVPNGGE